MKVALELDKTQLDKIIADTSFSTELREKATQAKERVTYMEQSVKTWRDLESLLRSFPRSLFIEDFISLLKNSGWQPPQN